MKKSTFLLSLSLLLSFGINAQSNNDKFWSPISESAIKQSGKRQIVPNKYLAFQLNGNELKTQLLSAPHEKNVRINQSTCIITLPLPNGTIQQFKVVESPIMEPGLAAQFPDIKTYSIKGIDDAYANGKLDWTPEFGFHGMVRSISGDYFIDPYCLQNLKDYITYYTADFVKDPSQKLPEVGVITDPEKTQSSTSPKKKGENEAAISSMPPPALCVGAQLRTYRLAVACTGEYAVAATGSATPTVAQTLAKIVTSVNRVDGVYETEVAVRLVLVATETLVVFTTAAGDPFNGNNNAGTLIGESQTVITANIGSANYDIGHTFSTGGGGLANLGCVCSTSNKARGITGSPSPVGDPYDIDYVAHEMGHQFAGNHTFNSTVSSCNGNRNASTAVEPGSGITIMAYAGICGSQDLAPNSIAYFHAISYDEIVNFTNGGSGNICPVTTTTGNQPPVVTGSGNYVVPKSTPFILTGSALDPDGDALTYSWEETNLGVAGNWNSGNKNFFMSYTPTPTPSRLFPKQSVVLSGNYTGTKGEYVPATAQTLQFRLTARDNKMGGGGVCYAINNVTVSGTAGPLSVTYPDATAIVWGVGTPQTITWAVNGTNAAPVSCDSVRVLISYNGGTTYSTLLGSTPNDGTELITAPTLTATIATCRIKVESKGNIFYDVSNNNFTISINVGLNPFSKNNPIGLSVWPNPFNNEVNFAVGNLQSESVTEVKVIDVLGKVIVHKKYNNKTELNETLDLSNVSTGVYFINVTNNNRSSYYRVVRN